MTSDEVLFKWRMLARHVEHRLRLARAVPALIAEIERLQLSENNMRAERDEARRQRDALCSRGAEVVRPPSLDELDEALAERDEARTDRDEARTERDEARREVELMRPVVAEAERMIDNRLVSGISHLAKVVGDYRSSRETP